MSDESNEQRASLTYAEAGVDIDAGSRLVEAIRAPVATTKRPEVLGGLGGFGGLFELPVDRYQRPVLVAGTDGVGTKLRLALAAERFNAIGIDLVAMCVNDVLVTGAEPLFFLDYYATAKLDSDVAARVIEGIAAGCRTAGAALIGGETAEMPDMYAPGDFDLAGFCVGIAEKDRLIDPSRVAPGDVVIGLTSSGPHANGYSLVRWILAASGAELDDKLDGQALADHLLAPTRIYAVAVQKLLAAAPVQALAHITGGGLPDNLARIVPDGLAFAIDATAWQPPPIFGWLAEHGNVEAAEMRRTFNNGIGLCAIVAAENRATALAALAAAGEQPRIIGGVRKRAAAQPAVVFE